MEWSEADKASRAQVGPHPEPVRKTETGSRDLSWRKDDLGPQITLYIIQRYKPWGRNQEEWLSLLVFPLPSLCNYGVKKENQIQHQAPNLWPCLYAKTYHQRQNKQCSQNLRVIFTKECTNTTCKILVKSFLNGQNSATNCFRVHTYLGKMWRTAHRKDRGLGDLERGT